MCTALASTTLFSLPLRRVAVLLAALGGSHAAASSSSLLPLWGRSSRLIALACSSARPGEPCGLALGEGPLIGLEGGYMY